MVISIIAVLVGILLPALSSARRSATNVKCLSNIRQVALAMASYEADAQRLPVHLYEILPDTGVPEQMARNTGNPDHDIRDLYTQYMGSANYFSCPFQPEWDKSETAIPVASKRLYTDYQLIPGYFTDFESGVYSWPLSNWSTGPKQGVWIDTATPWEYDERRIDVIASDRVSYDGGYTRFNHPLKGNEYAVGEDVADINNAWMATQFWVPNSASGGDNVRELTEANYAFKDGHAKTFRGNDDEMITVTGPVMRDGVPVSNARH